MFQLLRHGVDRYLLLAKSSCFSLKYFASLFEVIPYSVQALFLLFLPLGKGSFTRGYLKYK